MKISTPTATSIFICICLVARSVKGTTITSGPAFTHPLTTSNGNSNSNFNSTSPTATATATATPGANPTTTIHHSTAITHDLPALVTGGDLPEASAFLNQQKYWISTYYSCNTRWETVHCGTHEQVLKGTGPNGESLPEGGQPLTTAPSSWGASLKEEGKRKGMRGGVLVGVLVAGLGGGWIW